MTVFVLPLAVLALMVAAYSGSSCSAGVACRYRSAALDVGEALGLPTDADTATALSTPAWLYGITTLAVFAGTAGFVATQLARPRPGPVTVGRVVEIGLNDSNERPDLQAIMLDRLARAGIQAPSTVPAALVAPQTDQPPTKLADVPGFVTKILARLTARNTERVGYNIDATLRQSERIRHYGMTFSVTNRANGRQLATDTIWAQTKEETARMVAFHVAALIANLDTPPSTSRAPVWAPGPQSLRAYEDASYFIEEGRLDEAIISCSSGLEIDPASLPLRYLLGTLHERFGHFLNAIDTYTSALNILMYDGVAFSRPDKHRGKKPIVLATPGRRVGRRIVSDEATQIMWRYAVALTFGHRWIGRWLHDLRRSDGEYPHAPLGYRRTTRRALSASPAAKSALDSLEADELRYRTELAKRLRGFFHVRYQSLLSSSFPLLETCIFGEQRLQPLGDDSGPRDQLPIGTPPPRLSEEVEDLLERRPGRHRHSDTTIKEWMIWMLRRGLEYQACVPAEKRKRWTNRVSSWQDAPAGEPVSTFYSQTDSDGSAESTRRNRSDPDLASTVSMLCRALDRGSPDQEDESNEDWFSRQRLAVLIYHIGIDLLDSPTRTRADGEPEEGLSEEDRDRIGFLVVQLDLRFFFLRCALFEMEMLRQRWPWRRRELWTRPFLSPQLVRTIERGAVYRCQERICELMHDLPDRSEAPSNHELDAAMEEATVGPGRLGRRSERIRGWATGEGDWNLWYYEACVHAQTMLRPPDLEQSRPTGIASEGRQPDAGTIASDGASDDAPHLAVDGQR
ncbi:MAG: hypothetical protein OEV40_27605, partial [Acidimicrobiia bacterium]|nr:hypothetical protein [Acidimicrobiia bacterium]